MGFIDEIVQTRGWKKFMAKVYGWGASVVLIGAMFKINHWNGATIMLVVGLSTEAFIFFTSAFEPLFMEWDWSLAYPELAGMNEEIEDEDMKKEPKKTPLEKFDELITVGNITPELFEKLGKGLRSLNKTTETLSDVSGASIATNNYIANFDKASSKINEFVNLYGQSAQSLHSSASSLAKSYEKSAEVVTNSSETFSDTISQSGTKVAKMITDSGKKLSEVVAGNASTLANTMSQSANDVAKMINDSGKKISEVVASSVGTFSDNMSQSGANVANMVNDSVQKISQVVAGSVGTFSDNMSQSGVNAAKMVNDSVQKISQVVAGSIETFSDNMSQSGTNVAKMVNDSGKKLSESYEKLADTMNAEFEVSQTGSKNYTEQLQIMSKNLTALNSIYELQLQDTNEHLESAKNLFSGMEEIISNMKNSADDVKKYREEISKLGQNLTAMNTIYGNMLSAMNFSK